MRAHDLLAWTKAGVHDGCKIMIIGKRASFRVIPIGDLSLKAEHVCR